MFDYLSELAILQNEKINTEYKYLDTYFKEKNRKAYFIKLKNETIGFAFVNDYCLQKTNEIAIAEFYIKPTFRNMKYGILAFQELVLKNNLKWEVKTNVKNQKAIYFWEKAINKISSNNFQKETINYDIVFSFDSNE